jgi:thymidylate kinase
VKGEPCAFARANAVSTEEGDNVEDEEPSEGDAGRVEEVLAAVRFLVTLCRIAKSNKFGILSIMQHIVLIGGFGGSGKTTVSALLASELKSNALLEEDHLFRISPFEDWEKIGRIKTRNTHALISTFLDEGFEHVICAGYIWSQGELDGVVKEFGGDAVKVWLFWLDTPKHVRHGRAKMRGRDEADQTPFLEQIEEKFVKTLKLPLLNAGSEWAEIETTDKTPEQVTLEILQKIQKRDE